MPNAKMPFSLAVFNQIIDLVLQHHQKMLVQQGIDIATVNAPLMGKVIFFTSPHYQVYMQADEHGFKRLLNVGSSNSSNLNNLDNANDDFKVECNQSQPQPQSSMLSTSEITPDLTLTLKTRTKPTALTPSNVQKQAALNAANHQGQDAWMNWLKIEGDIATAKHLQMHLELLTISLESVLEPALAPLLGEEAATVTAWLRASQQYLQTSLELTQKNASRFLTHERAILTHVDDAKQWSDDLYHLQNDVERLAQRIAQLTR